MKIEYIIYIIVIAFVLSLLGYMRVEAKQETCPDGGEWTKIDSDDLSSYPVDGAVEYCFKASNYLLDEIPDGGFGQEGACTEEHPERCGLSHWSYRLGEQEPTPTDIPTPTETPTPTREVTPTASPTASLTPTSTPTPTDKPQEDKKEDNKNVYKNEQGESVDIGEPSQSGK